MYDIQWAGVVPDDLRQEPEDLERAIASIAESGYSGLELPAEWILREPSRVRDLCYAHQIAPVSARVALTPDDRDDPDSLQRILEALDALGAEQLILRSPAGADALTERLRAVGERCLAIGLRASYRPAGADLRNDSRTLSAALDALSGDGIGLALDMADRSLDIGAAWPGLWAKRCDYLTLPAPLTSGPIPLDVLAAALNDAEFSGWISVAAAPDAACGLQQLLAAARAQGREAFGA